jgi:hypothetical protein
MKGAQLESLLEMVRRLPKLDDISEPVLDEAERVLKEMGRRLSILAKRCSSRSSRLPPRGD